MIYSVDIVEFEEANMDKEVNRIRINKLYSENNIFDEIKFHDGVNIILGEKYDNSTIRGKKQMV